VYIGGDKTGKKKSYRQFFVDRTTISAKGGDGGHGVNSFEGNLKTLLTASPLVHTACTFSSV
jgi:hypothetical protein